MSDSAERHPDSRPDAAATLLAIIDGLAAESRPGFELRATLDSSLERDLGLDSLARVELISRIEDGFGVRLPEDTLSRAETPRDLLNALRSAGAAAHATGEAHAVQAPLARVEGLPSAAMTLVEALEWHVEAHPDRLHVLFYRTPEHTEQMTYAGLKAAAMAICAGLGRRGLVKGQSVAIMLPTCLEFFHCYYGILLAGGVPVPLYPPARLSQIEDHLRRQAGILDSCLAPILITVPEAKLAARFLEAEVASLQAVVTPHELASDGAGEQLGADGPAARGRRIHPIHLGEHGQSQGRGADARQPDGEHSRLGQGHTDGLDRRGGELVAAVSRHGPDRHLARQPLPCLPAGADVAAGFSGAAGALAVGDPYPPRHGRLRHRTSPTSCACAGCTTTRCRDWTSVRGVWRPMAPSR